MTIRLYYFRLFFHRNLWLAIVLALPSVIVLYLLTNISYFIAMDKTTLLNSDAVAMVSSTSNYYIFIILLPIDVGKGGFRAYGTYSSDSRIHQCTGHLQWIFVYERSLLYGRCTLWLFAGSVCLYSKATVDTIAWYCFWGWSKMELFLTGDWFRIFTGSTFDHLLHTK